MLFFEWLIVVFFWRSISLCNWITTEYSCFTVVDCLSILLKDFCNGWSSYSILTSWLDCFSICFYMTVKLALSDCFFFVRTFALEGFFLFFALVVDWYCLSVMGTSSSGLVSRLASPPPAISSAFPCTLCCNASFSCFSSYDYFSSSWTFSVLSLHFISSFSVMYYNKKCSRY